ncbi:MAG: hypothetical protein ACI8PP_001655, partial [Candidatus Pseudothioglobus sp.]
KDKSAVSPENGAGKTTENALEKAPETAVKSRRDKNSPYFIGKISQGKSNFGV